MIVSKLCFFMMDILFSSTGMILALTVPWLIDAVVVVIILLFHDFNIFNIFVRDYRNFLLSLSPVVAI